MDVKDPFNSGFFKALQEFEKVSAFVNDPLNPLPAVETGQCPLCGKLYRLLDFHYECASCGICYCEQCTCTKGTTPRYCDVCSALTSKNCRIHDFPGLARWINLNYKKHFKKITSHSAAIMFLSHLIGSKDHLLHNHIAIVMYRYLPVILTDGASERLLHNLHKHMVKCNCDGKAIALDSFISLELQQINPIFDITEFDLVSFINKNPENERTGARLIYVLAKLNAIDLSQSFIFKLLNSEDSITLSFILGAYANVFTLPTGMEIHNNLNKNERYQNDIELIEILMHKLDIPQPVSVLYYSFVILLRTVQNEEGNLYIKKYKPNVFFETITKSLEKAQKGDSRHASIAALASQIILLLWNSAYSANETEYLKQLFNSLLQVLANVMEIKVPYDPNNYFCVVQVIFVELIKLISKDNELGFAVQSEQITSFVNRINNKMVKKDSKKVPNSPLLGGTYDENEEEEEGDDLEAKEAEVAAQKQTIKDLEEINRRMLSQIEALSIELMDVTTEAEEEASKALEDIEEELEKVESQIENEESKIEDDINYCNNLKTKILEEESRRNTSQLDLNRIESEIKKQNDVLEKIKDKIISLSSDIEKSSELHQTVNTEEMESNINEKREEIILISKQSKIAESNLETKREQTKEQREKLFNLQTELQEKLNDNATIHAKILKRMSKVRNLESRAKETAEAAKSMSDRASNSSTLTGIEQRISATEQTAAELELEIKNIEAGEEKNRADYEKEIQKLNEDIENMKIKIEKEIEESRVLFRKQTQKIVHMWVEAARNI